MPSSSFSAAWAWLDTSWSDATLRLLSGKATPFACVEIITLEDERVSVQLDAYEVAEVLKDIPVHAVLLASKSSHFRQLLTQQNSAQHGIACTKPQTKPCSESHTRNAIFERGEAYSGLPSGFSSGEADPNNLGSRQSVSGMSDSWVRVENDAASPATLISNNNVATVSTPAGKRTRDPTMDSQPARRGQAGLRQPGIIPQSEEAEFADANIQQHPHQLPESVPKEVQEARQARRAERAQHARRGGNTSQQAPLNFMSGRPNLMIEEIVCQDQLTAAQAVIEWVYKEDVSADLDLSDVAKAAVLASRWGMHACMEALIARILASASDIYTPNTMDAILKLITSLPDLSAATKLHLQQKVRASIMSSYASTHHIFQNVAKFASFCALPFSVVSYWALLDDLETESEDSVCTLLTHWWVANQPGVIIKDGQALRSITTSHNSVCADESTHIPTVADLHAVEDQAYGSAATDADVDALTRQLGGIDIGSSSSSGRGTSSKYDMALIQSMVLTGRLRVARLSDTYFHFYLPHVPWFCMGQPELQAVAMLRSQHMAAGIAISGSRIFGLGGDLMWLAGHRSGGDAPTTCHVNAPSTSAPTGSARSTQAAPGGGSSASHSFSFFNTNNQQTKPHGVNGSAHQSQQQQTAPSGITSTGNTSFSNFTFSSSPSYAPAAASFPTTVPRTAHQARGFAPPPSSEQVGKSKPDSTAARPPSAQQHVHTQAPQPQSSHPGVHTQHDASTAGNGATAQSPGYALNRMNDTHHHYICWTVSVCKLSELFTTAAAHPNEQVLITTPGQFWHGLIWSVVMTYKHGDARPELRLSCQGLGLSEIAVLAASLDPCNAAAAQDPSADKHSASSSPAAVYSRSMQQLSVAPMLCEGSWFVLGMWDARTCQYTVSATNSVFIRSQDDLHVMDSFSIWRPDEQKVQSVQDLSQRLGAFDHLNLALLMQ